MTTTLPVTKPESWGKEGPPALPLEVLENTLGKQLRGGARCGRQATAVQELSREWGRGRAVMRSWRWAALHLGPPACSTAVSSYGQLGASLVTPHLALPSERAPGHGEGAVETLEGAGEPPTRPPAGPQLPASCTTDPLRDLGQMPSLPVYCQMMKIVYLAKMC